MRVAQGRAKVGKGAGGGNITTQSRAQEGKIVHTKSPAQNVPPYKTSTEKKMKVRFQ